MGDDTEMAGRVARRLQDERSNRNGNREDRKPDLLKWIAPLVLLLGMAATGYAQYLQIDANAQEIEQKADISYVDSQMKEQSLRSENAHDRIEARDREQDIRLNRMETTVEEIQNDIRRTREGVQKILIQMGIE